MIKQRKLGEDSYTIYRFVFKSTRPPKIVKTGLTLEEARKHCSQEDTHKAGKWFDGYQVNP